MLTGICIQSNSINPLSDIALINMLTLQLLQPFYGSLDFVWDNPGSRYQKVHFAIF